MKVSRLKIVPNQCGGLVIFLIGAIAHAAQGADFWTLSTSDFQAQTVTLHGFDEHGAAVTAIPSQIASTIGLNRFLEMVRVIPIRQHPSAFLLRLRNGDVLAGEPVSLSGESIVWREDVTGNRTVRLQDTQLFTRFLGRGGAGQRIKPGAGSDDVVQLANGDAVHGVLSDLTGAAVSIQPAAGGDATAIPLSSVTSVEFASLDNGNAPGATTTAAPMPAFRVHLTDDSILTAASMQGDDWTMHLTFAAAAPCDVPLSSIQSIEQVNGPVVWLSSLLPSENVQIPYLEAEHPARFDQNVMGGPIQFGDRVYTHGIGVHAYSRLTWTIDPADEHFRTQYAVDGAAPFAEMDVQIKVDGQVVHKQKNLRAGELSAVEDFNLKGKHTLTLEAIDSQNHGVQARLNWIEPAFLRTSPPPPTTPLLTTTNP